MDDRTKQEPLRRDDVAETAADRRRQRLAEELRANLKRRKMLARKRQTADTRPTDEENQPDRT